MSGPSRAAWKPSGIVTLCSDFGLSDPYVGVLHGVIHSTAGEGQRLAIVDLTHGVPPQDVATASFFLAKTFGYFPLGSVHVAVVDPGVGSERRILCAREAGHVFLAPDNGLLGSLLTDGSEVRALDVERFALPHKSATFHGRDVFAPAAARIAGGFDPSEVGPLAERTVQIASARPRVREVDVEGRVLFVDRFGNLVTNVVDSDLGGDASRWEAEAASVRMPLRANYSQARPGELVALVNSYRCLELAVAGGSARDRLGLAPGDRVVFRRK